MSSRSIPYTSGDIQKSGKLGKMLDITTSSATANSLSSASLSLSSGGATSNSCQLRKSLGSFSLLAVGLTTSSLISSTSTSTSSPLGCQSGQLDTLASKKVAAYRVAVMKVGDKDERFGFRVLKIVVLVGVLVLAGNENEDGYPDIQRRWGWVKKISLFEDGYKDGER